MPGLSSIQFFIHLFASYDRSLLYFGDILLEIMEILKTFSPESQTS